MLSFALPRRQSWQPLFHTDTTYEDTAVSNDAGWPKEKNPPATEENNDLLDFTR